MYEANLIIFESPNQIQFHSDNAKMIYFFLFSFSKTLLPLNKSLMAHKLISLSWSKQEQWARNLINSETSQCLIFIFNFFYGIFTFFDTFLNGDDLCHSIRPYIVRMGSLIPGDRPKLAHSRPKLTIALLSILHLGCFGPIWAIWLISEQK